MLFRSEKQKAKKQGLQEIELGQSMSLIMKEAFRTIEAEYASYRISKMRVTGGMILTGPVASRTGYTQKTHTDLPELPREKWKSREYYIDIEYVTDDGCLSTLTFSGRLFDRVGFWEVYVFPKWKMPLIFG